MGFYKLIRVSLVKKSLKTIDECTCFLLKVNYDSITRFHDIPVLFLKLALKRH